MSALAGLFAEPKKSRPVQSKLNATCRMLALVVR